MKYYFNISIILLLVLGFPLQALTVEEIKKPTGKGYWNYEIVPKKNKDKTSKPTLPPLPPTPAPLPTSEVLMKLHPDQLKVLVKQWRKYAVYTLDPHDVSEALRIQDVTRKKSAAYAAVVGFVSQKNPNLTLADELPITNAGKQAQYDRRELAMNKLIIRHEKHYGLLYFTSKNCEYCRIQDGVLAQFLRSFNYTIKSVEFQENSKLALKFNIKQTPTVILVNQRTKKWIPAAFGSTSLPSFIEGVYRGIRYIQEEIAPAQFFTNESDIGTGLDPTNKQE